MQACYRPTHTFLKKVRRSSYARRPTRLQCRALMHSLLLLLLLLLALQHLLQHSLHRLQLPLQRSDPSALVPHDQPACRQLLLLVRCQQLLLLLRRSLHLRICSCNAVIRASCCAASCCCCSAACSCSVSLSCRALICAACCAATCCATSSVCWCAFSLVICSPCRAVVARRAGVRYSQLPLQTQDLLSLLHNVLPLHDEALVVC